MSHFRWVVGTNIVIALLGAFGLYWDDAYGVGIPTVVWAPFYIFIYPITILIAGLGTTMLCVAALSTFIQGRRRTSRINQRL